MGPVLATVPRRRGARPPRQRGARPDRPGWAFGALIAAGFRRYSTYRQATLASICTNSVFGFLRCFVLLAALAGAGTATVGGYSGTQLATYAFVGYYPALALLGVDDPLGAPAWVSWGTPFVALVAAGVAGIVWRFGVRHYRSTGS